MKNNEPSMGLPPDPTVCPTWDSKTHIQCSQLICVGVMVPGVCGSQDPAAQGAELPALLGSFPSWGPFALPLGCRVFSMLGVLGPICLLSAFKDEASGFPRDQLWLGPGCEPSA